MRQGMSSWGCRAVLAGMVALAALSVQAETEVVGNLQWTFDVNASGTVTVQGVEQVKSGKVNSLTIPDTLGGRAVTCVGADFYPDFEGVKTLVLGDNVTELEDGVFGGYEDLKSVTGGRNLRKVGFEVFYDTRFLCGDKYIDYSFVDDEEEAAYYNGLELVYVGTFVVGRRGELADRWDLEPWYAECGFFFDEEDEECWWGHWYYDETSGQWLDNEWYEFDPKSNDWVLGNWVSDGYDDSGCPIPWNYDYQLDLRPDTTGIASGVFEELPITKVVLPDSVKFIGESAFEDCARLRALSFGSGVREIGANAFRCAGCDLICTYRGPGIDRLTFPSSLERIGEDAFKDFAVLKYVDGLGSGVQLGADGDVKEVFGGTPYAEGWNFPVLDREGNTVWGFDWQWGWDEGCVKDGVLTIPEGVTKIEESAFRSDWNIKKVVLPSSLKEIGDEAFYNCLNLKTVSGGANLEKVGFEAFAETRFVVGSLYFYENGDVVDDDYCEDGDCEDSAYVDPEEQARMERLRAYWHTIVPVYVGDFVVGSRGGLLQSDNEEYWRETDDGDVWTWSYTLTLRDGTTGIAAGAFCEPYCEQPAITELVCPASLRTIGDCAFGECDCLKKVVFKGNAPEYGEDCFLPNYYRDEDYYMVVEVYRDAAGWSGDGYWHGFSLSLVDRPVPPGGAADPVAPPPPASDVTPVQEAGVVGAVANAKAMTVGGVVLDGLHVVGSVEITVGKPGAKGTKLGGSVTLFGGKKLAAKAQNADLAAGAQTVAFTVKDQGTMTLKIGAQADGTVSYVGTLGTYVVTSAPVGGLVTGSAAFSLPDGFAETLQDGEVNADLLPDGLPVTMSGKKWTCPKTGSVAYKKDKESGEMDWVLNGGKDAPDKTNFAALKLNYTPKTGAFKGSFKAYSLVNGKLKKTTVTVTGVLVGRTAFGSASVKKVGSWRVVIE